MSQYLRSWQNIHPFADLSDPDATPSKKKTLAKRPTPPRTVRVCHLPRVESKYTKLHIIRILFRDTQSLFQSSDPLCGSHKHFIMYLKELTRLGHAFY